jgi:hypothetical protein
LKILVVGLNPSRKHGNSPSLKLLFKWFDELGIQYASFINLYEGYEINGSACQIEFIRDISKEYDRVLALGQTVSDHLSRVDVHHYSLPHPSGLNRLLNDKKYVHDQLEACKNYLRGEP